MQAQGFPEREGIFPRVAFRWVEGDPSSLDALRSARLQDAHAIVIGGGAQKAAKEADAFTLTTITLAQVRRRFPRTWGFHRGLFRVSRACGGSRTRLSSVAAPPRPPRRPTRSRSPPSRSRRCAAGLARDT